MATAGGYLAEAYVMRKIHKEKMKAKAQDEEPERNPIPRQTKANSPPGACFLGISLRKKVHPNLNGQRANTCDPTLA